MYSLRHRLGIAISVSAVAIVVSYPVIAKPLPRSKSILASQVTNKPVVKDLGSRQPTDAILANIRLKLPIPAKSPKLAPRPVAIVKSVARTTKKSQHIRADRSSQGTETFTKVDRGSQRNQSSGIDRWVD